MSITLTINRASTERIVAARNKGKVERVFGLDLARAIAISIVLLSHFSKGLEPLGFWGVELFFGLSGFLIGQILWRGFSRTKKWTTVQLVNFWSRRWWRTLPNYYLFFIISIFFHSFIWTSLPSFTELTKFLWFGQNLFSKNNAFYGVSWSLCIEEWFYLLFPLVLLLFNLFRLTKKQCFIFTLFVFFIGSAVVRYLIKDSIGDMVRLITFTRLDAIAFGVLAAFLSMTIKRSALFRIVAFVCGFVLLIYAVFLSYFSGLSYEEVKQAQVLLVITPLGFSLILPFANLLPSLRNSWSFLTTIVSKLSLWSYSIYLCHVPVMFTVYELMDGFRTNIYMNLLSKLIGLFITIVISGLLFKYFELPLTKKRPAEVIF